MRALTAKQFIEVRNWTLDYFEYMAEDRGLPHGAPEEEDPFKGVPWEAESVVRVE